MSLRDSLVERIKKDYGFALFYFWPALRSRNPDLVAYASKIGYGPEEALAMREDLLGTELWKTSADGDIQVVQDSLGLGDLSVLDYLTMSMNTVARMSETGPCWYESFFVVTNENLIREFYSEINKVTRAFVEKSLKARGDTVMVWNHSTLDCLKEIEMKKQNPIPGKKT